MHLEVRCMFDHAQELEIEISRPLPNLCSRDGTQYAGIQAFSSMSLTYHLSHRPRVLPHLPPGREEFRATALSAAGRAGLLLARYVVIHTLILIVRNILLSIQQTK